MPGLRLTQQERNRIEAMWIAGLTFPDIAAALGRDRSTIWREVSRNHSRTHGLKHAGRQRGEALRAAANRGHGLYRWGYEADAAHARAASRARRPRQVKLGFVPTPRASAKRYRPRGNGIGGLGQWLRSGCPDRAAGGCVGQAAPPLVPDADLGVAVSSARRAPGAAGVARDDLSSALRAGAWRAAQGADPPGSPAAGSACPSTKIGHGRRRPVSPPVGRRFQHQPATCRSCRSGGARALGG